MPFVFFNEVGVEPISFVGANPRGSQLPAIMGCYHYLHVSQEVREVETSIEIRELQTPIEIRYLDADGCRTKP